MKISYDPEVDALYIRLIEGKHECRTVRLNEEIALNIGLGEKLVGIEILDATDVLGQGRLPDVTIVNIPLAAAPRLSRQEENVQGGCHRHAILGTGSLRRLSQSRSPALSPAGRN